MLNKMIISAVCVFFIFSSAYAMQGGMSHGKWWRNPQVSQKINISSEEIDALDKLFIESRRKRIELKSTVEKEQFELETLTESKEFNEKAIMEQFTRLQNARMAIATEIFSFLIQTRKILGHERFVQLKAMYKDIRGGKGKKHHQSKNKKQSG